MHEQNLDISELVAKKMQQPVKTKEGRVIVNDDGSPMTIMEAIATTIVQNAMKGDSSSILLVRNITKRSISYEELQKSKHDYEERMQYYKGIIRNELKSDNLWYGDMIEIDMMAMIMCDIERIEQAMQMSDYEDLIVDLRKDGTQSRYINPLHKRLDDLRVQAKQLKQTICDKQKERRKKGVMAADIEF